MTIPRVIFFEQKVPWIERIDDLWISYLQVVWVYPLSSLDNTGKLFQSQSTHTRLLTHVNQYIERSYDSMAIATFEGVKWLSVSYFNINVPVIKLILQYTFFH